LQEPAASETHEAVAAEIEPASSESAAIGTETAAPTESASQLDVTVASTPASAVASEQPAESDLIEVWRPGRSEGRRRPRDRRREPRRHTGIETQKPAEAAGEPAVAVSTESRPSSEQAATSPPPKSGRPPRHRRHGGEHRQETRQDNRQNNRQDRGERPQRERERPQARPARFERREREKAPDPNSPFAKLAALKAQLEAEAKERR
jgi:ATP-dependent RNA helicase SUPV3L1/SUV3